MERDEKGGLVVIGRQSPILAADKSTSKQKIHKDVQKRESKWLATEASESKSKTNQNL